MENNRQTAEMASFTDRLAMDTFGQTRTAALRTNTCVVCREDVKSFRDAISEKEYGISGYCQACQDTVQSDEFAEEYLSPDEIVLDIDPRY